MTGELISTGIVEVYPQLESYIMEKCVSGSILQHKKMKESTDHIRSLTFRFFNLEKDILFGPNGTAESTLSPTAISSKDVNSSTSLPSVSGKSAKTEKSRAPQVLRSELSTSFTRTAPKAHPKSAHTMFRRGNLAKRSTQHTKASAIRLNHSFSQLDKALPTIREVKIFLFNCRKSQPLNVFISNSSGRSYCVVQKLIKTSTISIDHNC